MDAPSRNAVTIPSMFTLVRIRPLDSARRSAVRYVPALLFTRLIGMGRFLIVAKLLGAARQPEFGRYSLWLELINWCVPVLMLGLGDVAERHAADFARHGRLGALIRRHAARLAAMALPAVACIMLASPFVGGALLREPGLSGAAAGGILSLIALNALALVYYQYTATLLRGLRAYTASATMETLASLLLLGFSVAAALAPAGNALWLLAAYAASNLLPAALLSVEIRRFMRLPVTPLAEGAPEPRHPRPSFATFALARLLLTMTFGLLAMWSVKYLSPAAMADRLAGQFTMPYRVGQFLGFAGVTLWSSAYAIAASAWAAGDRNRARGLLLKIGGAGGLALAAAGAMVLVCKPVLLMLLDASYRPAIEAFLSPALGMFILYAMLAWASLMGDLHECSWIGALLWGIAVCTQLAVLLGLHLSQARISPGGASLAASTAGLLLALVAGLAFVPGLLRALRSG